MISNLTRNTVVASRVEVAKTPWLRMKGLLGRTAMGQGEALVITRCQSIHMFFMKFPIDVIFCDCRNNVVGLAKGIKPFCFSPIFFRASFAIELPAGTIHATGTQPGDLLSCP
jgi:uncharacterized membrane protein (UPF0127 family)